MASKVNFLKMPESDLKAAFNLYKSALQPIIEEAFGWDDDFQYNRFHSKYDSSWFHWIEVNSELIGYVCFFETSSELHVSLLINFESFRHKTSMVYGNLS